ncbi:MAG: glycosyltransferase [Leifsonia sp.]
MRAIAVVIPCNDEEELLPRCLASVSAAIDHLRATIAHPPAVLVTIVLDDCRDRSESIARASGFEVVVTEGHTVGSARAEGVASALARLDGVSRNGVAEIWIANTDADSAVPPTWLTTQFALAESGCDLMVGTVRPDPADLSDAQRAAWLATHVLGEANGHVHGANLGHRADRYLEVGGFGAVAEHEDVRLVERMRALPGLREVATDECWVLTSGRPVGRTPGGYARHLRDDLVPAEAVA